MSEWFQDAACGGNSHATGNYDLWFEFLLRESAKRTCEGCPVQRDCLEYALVNRVPHGVWGGTDEEERRKWSRTWAARTRMGLQMSRVDYLGQRRDERNTERRQLERQRHEEQLALELENCELESA